MRFATTVFLEVEADDPWLALKEINRELRRTEITLSQLLKRCGLSRLPQGYKRIEVALAQELGFARLRKVFFAVSPGQKLPEGLTELIGRTRQDSLEIELRQALRANESWRENLEKVLFWRGAGDSGERGWHGLLEWLKV